MQLLKLLFTTVLLICVLNIFSQEPKDTMYFDGKTPVELQGENIFITPPAYFLPLKDRAGFIHIGSSSSMIIKTIEGTPYNLIVNSLTEEHFAKENIKFIAKENIKTKAGIDGTFILISFKVENKLKRSPDDDDTVEFERLMFFTGDYNRTIWISANYPAGLRTVLFEVFKESILSVEFE